MMSLFESTAALTIAAALLASTLAAMQQGARIGAVAAKLSQRFFAERQFEALIDRAALAAGSGPARPLPLRDLSSEQAVFRADLDGDGSVSESGSETTAVEIVRDASRTRLRHRLGHQTMTVVEFDNASATVTAYDRFGNATLAPTAALVEVRVERGEHLALEAAGSDAELHLLFAIPEATRR